MSQHRLTAHKHSIHSVQAGAVHTWCFVNSVHPALYTNLPALSCSATDGMLTSPLLEHQFNKDQDRFMPDRGTGGSCTPSQFSKMVKEMQNPTKKSPGCGRDC